MLPHPTMENKPNKIIVHHSAAVDPTPQFDAINQWHKDRDFLLSSLGFYVGYHYVIEKSGELRTAKNENEEGCHTIGQNLQSIGICLAGNFDIEIPTNEQIATLGDMLVSITGRYMLDPHEIYPHRAFQQKDCYGTRLGDDWARSVYFDHEIKRFTLERQQLKNIL